MGNARSRPQSPRTASVNSLQRFRVRFMLRASQYDFRQLTPNTTDFNENEPLRLTRRQRALVSEAWRSANEKGSNTAGVWIFKRIFSRKPEIQRIFKFHAIPAKHLEDSVRFQRHTQVFTNLLEIIVTSLDQVDDNLAPLLLYYGSKHAHIESTLDVPELKQEYWVEFGRSMTEFATHFRLPRHLKEALQAWELLMQYVVKKLWEGYELERERIITHLHEPQASSAPPRLPPPPKVLLPNNA